MLHLHASFGGHECACIHSSIYILVYTWAFTHKHTHASSKFTNIRTKHIHVYMSAHRSLQTQKTQAPSDRQTNRQANRQTHTFSFQSPPTLTPLHISHSRTYECMHVLCPHTTMHASTRTCARTYTHTHTYMHTHTHTKHAHTHTHTHMHTHTVWRTNSTDHSDAVTTAEGTMGLWVVQLNEFTGCLAWHDHGWVVVMLILQTSQTEVKPMACSCNTPTEDDCSFLSILLKKCYLSLM